jgi:hypothetical protein
MHTRSPDAVPSAAGGAPRKPALRRAAARERREELTLEEFPDRAR